MAGQQEIWVHCRVTAWPSRRLKAVSSGATYTAVNFTPRWLFLPTSTIHALLHRPKYRGTWGIFFQRDIVRPFDLWASQDDPNFTIVQPSPLEYARASVIETLYILESAAKLIPIPFLKEAIHLALTVLRACEVSLLLFLSHFIKWILLGNNRS